MTNQSDIDTVTIAGQKINVVNPYSSKEFSDKSNPIYRYNKALYKISGKLGIIEFYNWEKDELETSYSLDIFKNNERDMARHKLIVEYPHPRIDVIDTLLHVKRLINVLDDDTLVYSSKFAFYFSKGEYKYCGAKVLKKLHLLKKEMINYFDLDNFSEFSKYFFKSNLPRHHKKAIADILV